MKTQLYGAAVLASAVALSSGCATSNGSDAGDMVSRAELEKYETELANKQAEINRLKEQAASADSSSYASAAPMSAGGASDLFPPNAQPGHCYARVLIPATFVSESETVLNREASFRYELIPAQFETVQEQVLVREASSRLEVVPATYTEVTEQVLVRPASSRLVEVPAEYETVSEQVLDKPAHTVWKRGAGPIDGALQTAVDHSTGEVMCLVEVPATYKTLTKTVLVTPATTREVEIPAEYKTVTRTVVDTPATTRTIEIPAEYKTVQSEKLVTPASQRKIDIPAEYVTVNKRKKVSEEKMEWREVLCKDNMTNDVVRSLQAGLDNAGYLKGSVDGILGPNTLRAANSYAKANKLPVGKNYIAVETASALGVDL